jgi:DNA-binding PadR family transcriptional regulator
MYELMILSTLIREATHGYSITRIMNDMVGPVLKISHGSLYPRLRKMEQEGLISAAAQGDEGNEQARNVRTYTITDAGRRRFHELMMDTTGNPGEYSKLFWQKACALDCLHPVEQLELIDHYQNYCQAHTLHLKATTRQVIDGKAHYHNMPLIQLELTLHALRRAAAHWQIETDYASSLREKLLAKILSGKNDEASNLPIPVENVV